MHGLEGKNFFVTGGGSGIGRSTCEHLVNYGAGVAVVDLNKDNAESVAAKLRDKGGAAIGLACDVSREDAVVDAIAQAQSELGILSGAVTSAGVNFEEDRLDLADIQIDTFMRTLEINLAGTFIVLKHIIPALVESGGGSVVTIASTAGIRGGSSQGFGYTASKGGVVSLMQNLSAIYGGQNVRVNAICPGATAGEGMGSFFSTAEGQAAVSQIIPMKRVGQSEEVGSAVVYLLSSDASYINGQAVVVDGGATAK